MAKRKKSKSVRWQEAVAEALTARENVVAAAADLEAALGALVEVQGEYQDWHDNMPENAQGSATYEKLEAVCELALETEGPLENWDTVSEALDEAESIELPLGFGRD